MEERLQKILARAGYGSRRACEQFLSERGYSIHKLDDAYPGDTWIVGNYIAYPNVNK